MIIYNDHLQCSFVLLLLLLLLFLQNPKCSLHQEGESNSEVTTTSIVCGLRELDLPESAGSGVRFWTPSRCLRHSCQCIATREERRQKRTVSDNKVDVTYNRFRVFECVWWWRKSYSSIDQHVHNYFGQCCATCHAEFVHKLSYAICTNHIMHDSLLLQIVTIIVIMWFFKVCGESSVFLHNFTISHIQTSFSAIILLFVQLQIQSQCKLYFN